MRYFNVIIVVKMNHGKYYLYKLSKNFHNKKHMAKTREGWLNFVAKSKRLFIWEMPSELAVDGKSRPSSTDSP